MLLCKYLLYLLAASVRKVGVRLTTPRLIAATPILLFGLLPIVRIPLKILPSKRKCRNIITHNDIKLSEYPYRQANRRKSAEMRA
jgi:hypothetical protein